MAPLRRDALARTDRQHAAHRRHVDRIINTPNEQAGATPAGDEHKLRGIPAIGRGVTGAIHGTRPEDVVEAHRFLGFR